VDASQSTDAIPSVRVLVATAATFIMLFVVSLRLFAVLWHREAFEDVTKQPGGWAGAIILFVCGGAFHELLHGVAVGER
jgi:hypothetical protein